MPGTLLIGFRNANGTYSVVSAANPLPVTGGGDVNLTQINGTATDVGAGNAGAGTQRVVIATDQAAVPVSGPLTNAQMVALNPATTTLQTALNTLVGAQSAAAWTTGDSTLMSLLKAIATAAIATAPTLTQNVPLSVRRTITPGTDVAAGKALAVNCTTAGVLTIELSSGDTMAFNLATGPAFFDDIAAIDIAWSSGGAGTAYVLDIP